MHPMSIYQVICSLKIEIWYLSKPKPIDLAAPAAIGALGKL